MITSDPRMDLERLVREGEEYDLPGLIARARGDEDLIADLIELDGRHRVAGGRSVSLDRYLKAVPHLEASLQLVDAAIDVTLRAMAQSQEGLERAGEELLSAYPHLRAQIEDAIALADCTDSVVTTPRRRRLALLELPLQLGPEIARGGKRFELRSLIGSGSEGSVYLAVDRELSDTPYPAWVAVKVFGAAAPDEVLDEATKARRVDSVYVVRTLDRGVGPTGLPFVVHEHVGGGTLADAISAKSAWLTVPKLVELVAKVARGLQAVHGAGLTHCDIKPSNILLTESHEPKLSDFGVSRRREPSDRQDSSTRIFGSLACAAPESFRERWRASLPVSDLYGLGAVLVHALTGRYINGETREDVLGTFGTGQRPATSDDALAEIDGRDADLGAIARRAVAMDPRDRYVSAESLALDLESWLRHEPIHWTKPGRWKRIRLAARRDPVAAGTIAAALLVVVGAAAAVAGQIGARNSDRLAAELKLVQEREKAIEERFVQVKELTEAATSTIVSMPSGRLAAEWFPLLAMMEAVAGPIILDPRGRTDIWSDRIELVDSMLAKCEEEGTADDLESCLWRTAQGFWLLRVNRPEDADRALARAYEGLRKHTEPSDRWLRYIEMLRAVGAVDRACAAKDPEAIRAAATVLSRETQYFDGRQTGTALHGLILESLQKAYGPDGLDDLVQEKRWRMRVRQVNNR